MRTRYRIELAVDSEVDWLMSQVSGAIYATHASSIRRNLNLLLDPNPNPNPNLKRADGLEASARRANLVRRISAPVSLIIFSVLLRGTSELDGSHSLL